MVELLHKICNMTSISITVLMVTLLFGLSSGQLPEHPDLKCRLSVAYPGFKTLAQQFHVVRWLDGVIVKIRPKLLIEGSNQTVPLMVNYTDTFDPTLWIWAQAYGKYMLKFPLDHDILSLGILTLNTHSMDITFVDDPPGCAQEASTDELEEAFIPILTNASLDQNVYAITQVLSRHFFICRSAYTLSESESSITPLVGAKCCYKDLITDKIECDKEYTDNWELVWYGTTFVMAWLYITCIIIAIRIYFTTSVKYKTQSQVMMMDSMIKEVKRRLVFKLERYAYIIPLANHHTDLLSYNESITMATALGVSENKQANASKVLKKVAVVSAFVFYYTYAVVMGYFYSKKQNYILQLKDSASVYMNVFGHIGWFFSDPLFEIRNYAIAELCLTAIIPFLVMFLFYAVDDLTKMDTYHIYNNLFRKKKKKNAEKTPEKTKCAYFLGSTVGRILQIIAFVIVLLWIVIIGGVLVSYSCYFMLFGTIVALDKLSMWILPIYVAIYYIYSIFKPLKDFYKAVKEKIFSVCTEEYDYLVIRYKGHQFILEKIMDDFYYPRSRKHVFDAFIKSMVAIAFLMLLLIVVASAQNLAKFDIGEVKIVGYNMIVLLPLIATFLIRADKLVDLESHILEYDVQEYLKLWITDNETVVEEHRKRAELMQLKQEEKDAVQKIEDVANEGNSVNRERSVEDNKGDGGASETSKPEIKTDNDEMELETVFDRSENVNSTNV